MPKLISKPEPIAPSFKMKTALAIAALAAATICQASPLPIPIQAKGWVSTLREQKLNQEASIEIICRDRPLDELIILLAKTLDQAQPSQGESTNVIFSNTATFPLISGRFAGHPFSTIENLLAINNFIISERKGDFIIQPASIPSQVNLDTHYLAGLRLQDTTTDRPTLQESLDKIRSFLHIPALAENRITEAGHTVGWRENDSLSGKRIQYNPDDNTLVLNGTQQEHLWVSALVNNLNRNTDALALIIPETGQTFQTCTRQLIQLGRELPQSVTYDRQTWKLQPSGSTFIPSTITTQNTLPVGSIITLWIEEPQADQFTLHIKTRGDTIINGILIRSVKTSTLNISTGQPVTINLNNQTFHLVIKPGKNPSPQAQSQGIAPDKLRRAIEQFPRIRHLP